MHYKEIVPFIILCGFSTITLSEECYNSPKSETPSKRFEGKAPGTVFDTKTGLTWARCALGMKWEEGRCKNLPSRMTWNEADAVALEINQKNGYAGFSDWRLPTHEELSSLTEKQCYKPATNYEIFPDTPSTGFWTSSGDSRYGQSAWLVYFRNGSSYMGNHEYGWAVRMVRK